MDKSAIDTPSREIDLRNIPVHLRTALRRALEFEARAPAPRSAEEAEQCEEQLRAIADEFFGALLTPVLQRAVCSAAVGDAASALVRHLPRRMRSDGLETVNVRTSRGTTVPVTTPYYREKHARRAKRRPGLYPALVVLGIYDRCTPKLASDASRAVAMLSSLAEAQAQLRSDGIALDIKTLRSTAYRYAARARAAQQSAACGLLDRVTGKRVVVSLDGGRVRVRRKKRGPKTKKGRNRFHTCASGLLGLQPAGFDHTGERRRPAHGLVARVDARHAGGDAARLGGVLYMPNPRDIIQAIDAVTGDLLWEYRRDLPNDLDDYLFAVATNRNVAIYGNLIIDNSADDYVYAVDATTGEPAWETQILDYRTHPANQTPGPIVANGRVVSRRSCMPLGGPDACVITAHDAATGAELWRRRMITGPGEPGDETWGGVPFEQRAHVGAWMVLSYDPTLDLVYIGTSVTSPAPKFLLGGTDNTHLCHNSTLAFDGATGEIRWYCGQMPDRASVYRVFLIQPARIDASVSHSDRIPCFRIGAPDAEIDVD